MLCMVAQINTYDEAKAVYEPVKDNETSEVKKGSGMLHLFFHCVYDFSNILHHSTTCV